MCWPSWDTQCVTAATVYFGWAGEGTASLTWADKSVRQASRGDVKIWKGKSLPGEEGREAVGRGGREHRFGNL